MKRGRKIRDKLDDFDWAPTTRSRRKSNRVSDDMTPEEIEKLFAQQDEEQNSKKQIDPLYYSAYVDDTTGTFEIEKRFALLDNEQKKGLNSEDAARKVYIENAFPTEINDVDSWLQTDITWESQDSDDDDDFQFNPYRDEDFENEFTMERRRRRAMREKKIKISTFSDIFQLEKCGFSIERWPIRKLLQTNHVSAEGLLQIANPEKMRNFIEISNDKFHVSEDEISKYFKLDFINGVIIKDIVRKHIGDVDGVVIDPPLGINGYSTDDFMELLAQLKEVGPNPYMLIWVDPDTIEDVIFVANALKLDPCDSVAIELFDSMMEPIEFKTKNGFTQRTRMILLFRLVKTERSSLAQQRIMDTGWGIAYPNGKSGGRYGMPLVPNVILETLLPSKKKPRKFIEIWPNRYALRPNWFSFDEN